MSTQSDGQVTAQQSPAREPPPSHSQGAQRLGKQQTESGCFAMSGISRLSLKPPRRDTNTTGVFAFCADFCPRPAPVQALCLLCRLSPLPDRDRWLQACSPGRAEDPRAHTCSLPISCFQDSVVSPRIPGTGGNLKAGEGTRLMRAAVQRSKR